MYRFLLTPRWWAINLFALVAVPLCLFMGSWQLGRFEARLDDHAAAERRAETAAAARGEAEPLARLLPVTRDTAGRAARVTGRYDARHQFLVPGRTLDGRDGFYVLTPLLTRDGVRDGADGERRTALPVVRGWLPGEPEERRVPAPPEGEVTVVGAVQPSEHRDSPGVRAEGGLPPGQVGMISAASLVNLVPYRVHDAWLTLSETDSPLRPVPPTAPQGTGLDLKAFQNLGYTGEWFVFAGFVVFMWFRFFRREVEAAQDRALGLDPEGAADGDPGGDVEDAPEDAPEGDPEGDARAARGGAGAADGDADPAAVSAAGDAGRSRSPAASA